MHLCCNSGQDTLSLAARLGARATGHLEYPYQVHSEPAAIEEEGVSDYVAVSSGTSSPSGHQAGICDFKNPHRCFSFNHGIGAVVSAVAAAGLRVEALPEYPYSNGFRFGPMRLLDGARATVPAGFPQLPLMYGLTARR